MNEVELQAVGNEWAVDDSDVDYDSEASESGSDDTDGEVPEVTGVAKEVKPSGKPLVGGAAGKPLPKIPVWTSKPSAIASPKGSFTRGWKPVIDGKIQVASDVGDLKVRTSPMQATSTAPSSIKHASSENGSPSPAATGASELKKDGNESDNDVRRVPDMSSKGAISGATPAHPQGQSSGPRSRKRGAPADKEHKRLKRLLRNRVSAQQARERKKAYLSDLEVRSKELQQRNEELEERVSTLERENFMLRQIVKTTSLKKN